MTKILSSSNSRTSLFSTKVTSRAGHKSNAVRNRFSENVKMFDPELQVDNLGMHSPAKIYDTLSSQKKVARHNIKRENANYSFGKA